MTHQRYFNGVQMGFSLILMPLKNTNDKLRKQTLIRLIKTSSLKRESIMQMLKRLQRVQMQKRKKNQLATRII